VIPRCYVFLDDPSVLATRLTEVAQVVAETLGRSYPDVLQRVRYGRGVLVRDANPAEARLVGRALARMGMGVFSVPEGDLEPPPRRPKRISRVEVDAEGLKLSIRGLEHIPPVSLEWREIWGVAPHGVLLGTGSEERSSLPRRGASMAALSKPAAKLLADLRHHREIERRPIRLCLDVLADGSNLYRIHHDDVGVYAGLPERNEYTVENFLTLCRLIVDAAPKEVLIPDSVRRFLHTGAVESILYAKREALDSALLWMVQAYAYGVSFGDEVEDLDDDELTEEDEAILVEAVDDDDAEDLDDADLDDGSGDEVEDDAEEFEGDGAAVGSPVGAAASADEDTGDLAVGDVIGGADGLLEDADLDDADLDDADLSDEGLEADGDVTEALEHFEQTSRLDQAAIEAMLSQSRDLEDDLEDDDLDLEGEIAADGEIQNTLGLFDAASGPIDVRQLLKAEEENAGE
jgi:hypothetical protein